MTAKRWTVVRVEVFGRVDDTGSLVFSLDKPDGDHAVGVAQLEFAHDDGNLPAEPPVAAPVVDPKPPRRKRRSGTGRGDA